MLELLSPIFGALAGITLGARLGVIAAVIAGIVGFVLGRIIGRIPTILMIRMMQRRFRGKSAAELRADLRRPDCMTPNCILLELSSRGEDIKKDLDVVLALLESEEPSKRGFGWAALTSAFPDMARMISDFPINGSFAERKKICDRLRELAEQAGGTPPP